MGSDRISGAAMVHLEKELGPELARVIFDPGNVSMVREFAQTLAKAAMPTEMTIGGRTYDILIFLREGEDYVKGDVMVVRAKELSANLGEDDGQHLLEHQGDILTALRGKIAFVFTDWRNPGYSGAWPVCIGTVTSGCGAGAGSATASIASIAFCTANRRLVPCVLVTCFLVLWILGACVPACRQAGRYKNWGSTPL